MHLMKKTTPDVAASVHSATVAAHGHVSPTRRAFFFLRHLFEMTIAMMIGMGVGAVVLVLIFSTVLSSNVRGLTSNEVISKYPVLICLVVAAGMIATMAGWMHHRGMSGRPLVEMTTAMVVPLVPIFGLLWLDLIPGDSACGVYCIAMFPAMIVAMLFRIDLYAQRHTSHLSHAA